MKETITLSENNYGNYIHAETNLIKQFFNECHQSKNQVILDIGCGDGYHIKKICHTQNTVIGIDKNKNILNELADEVAAMNGEVSCIVGDIKEDTINFNPQVVDIILISHLLHYFNGKEIDQIFKKLNQWLKPGGKVFIQGLTAQSGPITHLEKSKRLKTKIAIFEKLKSYKRGMPDPGECEELFKNALPTVKNLKNLLFITSLRERAEFAGLKVLDNLTYYSPLLSDLEKPKYNEIDNQQNMTQQINQARLSMVMEKV